MSEPPVDGPAVDDRGSASARDGALALGAAAVVFVFALAPGSERMAPVGAAVAGAAAAVAVWLSGQRPRVALVAVALLALVAPLTNATVPAVDLVIILVAVRITVGADIPPLPVALVCFVALTIVDVWNRTVDGRSFADAGVLEPALITGLVVGLAWQGRRLRRQHAELVRLRDADRIRAVLEERRRIARDVHDVAAHHLSTVAVRAGLASRLDTPEAYRDAAKFAASTTTEALAALRSVVRTLGDGTDDPTLPLPRLADLDAIVERVGHAGLAVERTGGMSAAAAEDIPADLQVTVVRIVQEALTNVLRHRGPGRAWVDLRTDGPRLVATVEDDGPGDGPGDGPDPGTTRTGHGRGLLGMRERAAAAGGDLEVDPSPRGGWRVRASVPLRVSGTT